MSSQENYVLENEKLDFLLKLLDTPAPSGFEKPVADVVCDYASAWADEVHVDAIGNVHITVNKGSTGGRRMVTGHLDEIGFIASKFEDSGVLRFEQIGGWDLAVPVGQRVRVITQNGEIKGTVGQLAPHQRKDRSKAHTLKDMWIDLGATDKQELSSLVRIGDPIVLDATPHIFPNRRIMSRSADNRIGTFIAVETARLAKGADVEVVALCTTREENGLFGAMSGTYGVDPDEAIAVDVTWTSDLPGDHNVDTSLGKGPVITFGAATGFRIGGELVQIAEAANIPFQLDAAGRTTGTDADAVLKAGRGVPVGVVSVATRHLHSPGEVFDLADAEKSIDLILQWVTR